MQYITKGMFVMVVDASTVVEAKQTAERILRHSGIKAVAVEATKNSGNGRKKKGGSGPMKSIYISGPYTAPDREGEDKNILTAARVAAGYLRDGWAIFCPHTMTTLIDREFNSDRAIGYQDYLTLDLYWLAKCDAIHMLPGWRDSYGATLEYLMAKALGLQIRGDAP